MALGHTNDHLNISRFVFSPAEMPAFSLGLYRAFADGIIQKKVYLYSEN